MEPVFHSNKILNISTFPKDDVLLFCSKWVLLGMKIPGYFPFNTDSRKPETTNYLKESFKFKTLRNTIKLDGTTIYNLVLSILSFSWLVAALYYYKDYYEAFIFREGSTRGVVYYVTALLAGLIVLLNKIHALVEREHLLDFWEQSRDFINDLDSVLGPGTLKHNFYVLTIRKRSKFWFTFILLAVGLESITLSIVFAGSSYFGDTFSFFTTVLQPFHIFEIQIHIFCILWLIHFIELYKLAFMLIGEKVNQLQKLGETKRPITKGIDFNQEMEGLIVFYGKVENQVNSFNRVWGSKLTVDFTFPVCIVLLQLFSLVSVFVAQNANLENTLKFAVPGVICFFAVFKMATEADKVSKESIKFFSKLDKLSILKNINYITYQKVTIGQTSDIDCTITMFIHVSLFQLIVIAAITMFVFVLQTLLLLSRVCSRPVTIKTYFFNIDSNLLVSVTT